LSTAELFESTTGRGVHGVVDGRGVAVGSEAHMRDWSVDPSHLSAEADRLASAARTPMYVAVDGVLAGIVAVAAPIKPTSREAVRRLRAMGLDVVMLTGDNELTARAVAREA